ncbi:MAG: DUF5074 domain-containing protein [Muribaculaceae bacterium]|nr:DUF5074 domain-containing protein [Muribaculaceae bacterium]
MRKLLQKLIVSVALLLPALAFASEDSNNFEWIDDVTFNCVADDGAIHLTPRRIAGLMPIFTPQDAATWSNVEWSLDGAGSDRNTMLASLYTVNYWKPERIKFPELQAYRPGTCKLIVKVKNPADLSAAPFVKEFDVIINEDEPSTLEEGYVDGTIILNEEWFGHTNGGLNYITPESEIIYQAYQRENSCMAFGATSQHGTIWANKLIVVSKQAADGGDPLPGGGQLVIADAKTLKRLGFINKLTWNEESGDGRAVVGATPTKIYVSSSNGIFIVDISNPESPVVSGKIATDETSSTDLYNGQTGDMINAGKYVFALKQNFGIIVIDPQNDKVVDVIDDTTAQGITQSADGYVWYAGYEGPQSKFVQINPETLDVEKSVLMPERIGRVLCSWGAWRSTAFYGSYGSNDIWFVTGASGITGGATGDYYRWNADEDAENIEAFFSLSGVKGETEFGEQVDQMTYGTPRYDARNDRLIVLAGRKGAASGGYRDHWIHFVNGSTGDIEYTIDLEPYYWFQSLPIFPDKYAAEINVEDIKLEIGDDDFVLDLSDYVTDADNIDSNIRIYIDDVASQSLSNEIADITLEGRTLSVSPVAVGTTTFTLSAESNGRITSKAIEVAVTDISTGFDSVNGGNNGNILCNGKRITVVGLNGAEFTLYDINGRRLLSFVADSDTFVAQPDCAPGIYLLKGNNGMNAKIAIK